MAVEDSWHMKDPITKDKIRSKRYGRGKRWRVRNRGARTLSFHKKADAEAHDIKVNADLLQGKRPFDPTSGRVLFRDYATECVTQRYHNPRTRRSMMSYLRTHLDPYFGHKRMCDIRPSMVSSFRVALRSKPKLGGGPGEKLKLTTIKTIDALMVMIFGSAFRDELIGANPCDKATRQERPVKVQVQVWEHEVADAIVDRLPDRYQAIGLLSETCGHRQGESFGVALADVQFLRKKISITHQVQYLEGKLALVPPKGGKTRTVPLPKVAAAALSAHIKQYGTITVRCSCCGIEHEVIFSSEDGRLVNFHAFNDDAWNPAVTAAGKDLKNGLKPAGKRTGQHQLRHVYASTLIDGGASMKQVCDYMGHASILITADVYGHLFDDSHEKARNIIDKAFARRSYPERTAKDQ